MDHIGGVALALMHRRTRSLKNQSREVDGDHRESDTDRVGGNDILADIELGDLPGMTSREGVVDEGPGQTIVIAHVGLERIGTDTVEEPSGENCGYFSYPGEFVRFCFLVPSIFIMNTS